ncbi:MAG: hypothetical protein F9K40_01120 [Kofleriaceae bacterium]|nr:MAG: hypothetical protein F9K40_01120 [Kofleriaceae bacterium]MBZ0232208.1 hypothetical protein [Kofleriaceae bacterium]
MRRYVAMGACGAAILGAGVLMMVLLDASSSASQTPTAAAAPSEPGRAPTPAPVAGGEGSSSQDGRSVGDAVALPRRFLPKELGAPGLAISRSVSRPEAARPEPWDELETGITREFASEDAANGVLEVLAELCEVMHGGGYETARENDEELITIVMNARAQLDTIIDVEASRGALEPVWPLWVEACEPGGDGPDTTVAPR